MKLLSMSINLLNRNIFYALVFSFYVGNSFAASEHDDHQENQETTQQGHEHQEKGEKDSHAGEEDEHQEGAEGEEHDEKLIELSAKQIEYSGITLETAGAANIRETLPLYGQVVTNAEQVQSVSARFEGVITQITKKIGDAVHKGEVLARVESNDSLKVYPIKSVIDGIVIERNANRGEQTANRTLFKIADFSSVWVDLSLFPEDTDKVKVGQKAKINCSAAKVTGEGEIIYISPFGSSASQTNTARLLLENPQRLLVPGHFITAQITLAENRVPVAIDAQAVQVVEGRNVVFVKEGNAFEPREIKLGRTDGELIEVSSGLHAGDSYVSKNSFILKSEMGKEDAEHGH